MNMEKTFYTTKEVSELLGVSRVTVFKQIKSGNIKAQKVGHNYIILKEDLPEILNKSLKDFDKSNIQDAVKKVVDEYGETLKLLGRE